MDTPNENKTNTVKGKSWNEYQKRYSFITLNKKLSNEALLQKIEAMKRKTADLEKIINDRINEEKEMQVVLKEKEQLKMLIEKYGVVKSPETC